MATDQRVKAAQAYVDALSTGDKAKAQAAAPHLAKEIVVKVGPRTFEGYDEALKRITGVWPLTPVYRKIAWPAPQAAGDRVKVNAQMAPVGAGPSVVNLTFSFNDQDQITKVEQENVIGTLLVEADKLPQFVRDRVNNALANDTPLSVSYVDDQGRPHLSLRGSTRAYSDTQLSIWARGRETGLVAAVKKNPSMSLLYRDNPSRSTLIFMGKARIEDDERVRKEVFEATPEVEQNHESWTTGAAVIIDLEQVDGATPEGRVKFRRA